MRKRFILATLAASFLGQAAFAQTLFARYEAQTTRFQAAQPKWIVPVIAPYPMLIQVMRADFSRQISPTLVSNWNLGVSRGLNLIPVKNTEIDILVPPYMEHGDKTLDGFGDFSFTGKYRILASNEQHHNYLLSAQALVTVPTASYKNGATNATVTPTLMGGKGFGKFDAFTDLGGTLPTGNTLTIGRTIASNSVFQYHVQKYIWPELEINTTAFYGGAHDGKVQTFISPGIVLGKLAIHPNDPKSRLGIVIGAGFQTAATTYHAYNHAAILTGRFLF
jgi:hypothetical protein